MSIASTDDIQMIMNKVALFVIPVLKAPAVSIQLAGIYGSTSSP